MFRNLLRGIAAFVTGFVILIATGVITQNLFRGRMLAAAGWQPGTPPPSDYVWATLACDLVGSVLAGIALAWIAGKANKLTAPALILAVAVLRLYQYIGALEHNPHWYALVLVFIPAVFIPVGVMIARKISARTD